MTKYYKEQNCQYIDKTYYLDDKPFKFFNKVEPTLRTQSIIN